MGTHIERHLGMVYLLGIMLLACVLWAWEVDALAAEIPPSPPLVKRGVPHDATRYRADLVRSARLTWGLDAPVATFAAQIHQESGWRADARSQVGARGLAQFMSSTERWIAGAYPRDLAEGSALNPVWSLRALTRYDRWIWDRVAQASSLRPSNSQAGMPALLDGAPGCGRMAATLRGYNGGLGWVLREARTGQPCKAFRSAASCRENLDYPYRILYRYEPIYIAAGWGNGSCA